MVQTELDVLREVSQRFSDEGMEFMLTGSVAMNFYAEPRMTRDIDLVVALTEADAETVVRLFEEDFYIDPDVVKRAIARRSIFNMIHFDSVVKVDCIVRKDEPFRLEEFARRRQIHLPGFDTWIVSREDLLLSKLVWGKESGSEVQIKDARNLIVPECDMDYVRSRARLLSVSDLFEDLGRPHA
jgi:predicted nucleotidyltransferase